MLKMEGKVDNSLMQKVYCNDICGFFSEKTNQMLKVDGVGHALITQVHRYDNIYLNRSSIILIMSCLKKGD